jgi:hypothetical protein
MQTEDVERGEEMIRQLSSSKALLERSEVADIAVEAAHEP